MTLSPGIQRKLTTILAADAANYSGRMARNEVGTVTALRQARAHIDQTITTRGGRIANTSGDGLIAEFPSVVEAVGAAVAIQRKLNASHDGLAFRIGLHLGDVIVEGKDLLGDGVNLAARLQESAPEGGIIASQQVVDQAQGRLDAQFQLMRARSLKNMPGDFAI
ncbi:MAG: adenylate/guanylate cyclase domain-containing protein [Pseudomonadota bacterium]